MVDKLTKFDNGKKNAFLAAFSECGNLSLAARSSGVSRQSHYDWLETDKEYVAGFASATAVANDALEAEARRRAIDGWKEPIYQGGELVGYKQKYSDTMLAMLLNGNLPEKYRSRFEHTGAGGGPIQIQPVVQVYLPENNRSATPLLNGTNGSSNGQH